MQPPHLWFLQSPNLELYDRTSKEFPSKIWSLVFSFHKIPDLKKKENTQILCDCRQIWDCSTFVLPPLLELHFSSRLNSEHSKNLPPKCYCCSLQNRIINWWQISESEFVFHQFSDFDDVRIALLQQCCHSGLTNLWKITFSVTKKSGDTKAINY